MDVGDRAPEMVLDDHEDKEFRLSDVTGRGKRVFLSFHPLAWTGICAEQMKSLEKNADAFDELNCAAAGVSVDSAPCKKAWAEHLGIHRTPLLADFWPHGGAADSLGLFRKEEGISERANVIIDSSGEVVFYKVYNLGELPDIKEILEFLRE